MQVAQERLSNRLLRDPGYPDRVDLRAGVVWRYVWEFGVIADVLKDGRLVDCIGRVCGVVVDGKPVWKGV